MEVEPGLNQTKVAGGSIEQPLPNPAPNRLHARESSEPYAAGLPQRDISSSTALREAIENYNNGEVNT